MCHRFLDTPAHSTHYTKIHTPLIYHPVVNIKPLTYVGNSESLINLHLSIDNGFSEVKLTTWAAWHRRQAAKDQFWKGTNNEQQ